MKKNILFLVFAFSATLFMVACSKDKGQEVQVIQMITGAGDCINCEGWSWSNGEATTTNTSNDQEMHSFSFKVTISGELSFYHKKESYNYYIPILDVSINGKAYFHVESGPYNYAIKPSSIGSVKAGEIVTFSGRFYSVKDIQIVGVQDSSSDKEDPQEHQWDF